MIDSEVNLFSFFFRICPGNIVIEIAVGSSRFYFQSKRRASCKVCHKDCSCFSACLSGMYSWELPAATQMHLRTWHLSKKRRLMDNLWYVFQSVSNLIFTNQLEFSPPFTLPLNRHPRSRWAWPALQVSLQGARDAIMSFRGRGMDL